jgi:protein TonB
MAGEGPGKGLTPGSGPGGTGDGRGDGGLYVGEFGQGDGPRFRHRSPLRYPDAAKRAGVEGKVRLRLDIDAEGVLRNVAVVEHSGLEFVEEALRAIKASTFYPARRQGRSEACNALLTIRFALG